MFQLTLNNVKGTLLISTIKIFLDKSLDENCNCVTTLATFTDWIRMSICASDFTHLQKPNSGAFVTEGPFIGQKRTQIDNFPQVSNRSNKVQHITCVQHGTTSVRICFETASTPTTCPYIDQQSSCRLAQDGERFQLFLKLCCLIVAAMIYQSFTGAETDIYL